MKIKKIKKKMEEDLKNSQIKIINVEKRSSFLVVIAEYDGEFYEGVLIKGGFKKDEPLENNNKNDNLKKDDNKEKKDDDKED
jgi:hypothetical protein